MKQYIFAAILCITLMFSTGYARDIPDVMPPLEVTGLVTGINSIDMRQNIQSAAILNDRIVREGDIFEVIIPKDGPRYLGDKVVPGARVKVGKILLKVMAITEKGVVVIYSEKDLAFEMEEFVPLKSRPKVY